MEKGGEFGEAKSEAFGGGGAEGEVAAFAAATRGFAVEVAVDVGESEDLSRFGKVANQVDHGALGGDACRAEREAEDSAERGLNLAGHGGCEGPVRGSVDARGH